MLPRSLYTTKQLRELRPHLGSLPQMRVRGDGPPFLKLGTKVLYDLEEVDRWLAERVRSCTSTSDNVRIAA